MALTVCKDCGKEISKKAKQCPHCGAPVKKKTSILTWLVLAFLVFLLFVGASDKSPSDLSKRHSSPSSHAEETGVDTAEETSPAAYSPPALYLPPLEILSWSCNTEYGYIHVQGEVKNNSSQSIKNLMVVGEFRTKDNAFVKSADALIDYNPILPGQTSPFKAGTTTNPAISGCNVSFKQLFGKKVGSTTTKDIIKKTQEMLSELGHEVGVADGIMGSKTRSAIKKFQSSVGVPEDGKTSNSLLILLNKQPK